MIIYKFHLNIYMIPVRLWRGGKSWSRKCFWWIVYWIRSNKNVRCYWNLKPGASPYSRVKLEFGEDYLRFMILKHDRLLWPWAPHTEHTPFFLTNDFSNCMLKPLQISEKPVTAAEVSYPVGILSDEASAVRNRTQKTRVCRKPL
jgi:hypothetical protein